MDSGSHFIKACEHSAPGANAATMQRWWQTGGRVGGDTLIYLFYFFIFFWSITLMDTFLTQLQSDGSATESHIG